MAEAADAMGLSGDAAPWGSGPPPQGYAYSPEQVRQVPRPSAPAPAAPTNDTGPLSIPPEAQQFIKVVRTHEGTAEGAGFKLYGQGAGQSFQPGAEHPADTGWQGGHGPDGRETHAAGPGQWQPATWHGEADRIKKMGVEPNFADQNQQNWAMWDLGSRAYKAKTGTDLQTAIREGKADYTALGSIWAGLKQGVTPNLVNGPFNETAQPLITRWRSDIERRGKEYDSALEESKSLHSAARAMTEKWMTESDKPPKNMREAWSQWGGVAGAFALIGGLVGRNHTAAISAAGEMMQAANSADATAYDKAYKAWSDHLDRGMKIIELLDKDARQIVDDARKSYDQKVSELQVLSTVYQLKQQLDPKSVDNVTKNLTMQRLQNDLIRSNNEDARIRLSAADKDEAWLKDHPEAEGKIPNTVRGINYGEAQREINGVGANATITQKLSVAAPLEAKYIAEGMDRAEAHAKAYREAGIIPGGGGATQSKGREADLQKAIDADVAKFKEENPNATPQQIDNERYKARLTHEKEMGAAAHQPRSAGAMGLQKFLEENPNATADEIQTFAAKGAEKTSEGRAVGTRSANLEMAANTAAALIPLLKQTSDKIDRTEFPTVNSILIAAERGTGNTDVVRYSEMLNSLKYAYARALNPTGQARQGDLARFDEILALAWSKGQINAALDQMQQTINVEKTAIAQTRQEVRGGGVPVQPPSSASPQSVPSDLPDPKGLPEGRVAKSEGKPVAVIRGGKWVAP